MNDQSSHRATLAVVGGSLVASVGVGLSCLGPLLGIVLGVGGLGFLSRYRWLQGPATAATVALLAVGFVLAYGRRSQRCSAPRARRRLRLNRIVLWTATTLAVGLALFEHLVFPRL